MKQVKMNVGQLDDYNCLDAKRPLNRRVEEILRAEASRMRKRKTMKTLIKTGFKIRRTNVAHKYLKDASEIMQHACDIFLARCIARSDFNKSDLSRKEIIEKGVKKFQKLDSERLSYYLSAALIDDPKKSSPIASNAYHNFLLLHVEKAKRGKKNGKKKEIGNEVIKEGRSLWNKMNPRQKLPFFMLAYMNTYYPRELDGSVAATFMSFTKGILDESLKTAEKTLKLFDTEKSCEPTQFAGFKKNKLGPINPVKAKNVDNQSTASEASVSENSAAIRARKKWWKEAVDNAYEYAKNDERVKKAMALAEKKMRKSA